ncbi:MAG: sugar ABC transporter substrate-binding protein, partial [Chloroflexi bacterium]|nr:sugar ABC transporter substrate-binding protein [Chloroflexota bacterium]
AISVTAVTGGVATAQDTVEVVIWHMEQPPHRVQRFQQVIDQFNSSQPTIHVTQQVQDWNQIYSKIAGAVTSGTQPDILFTIPDFTTYVRTTGGVQAVTALVNELDAAHHFLPAATAAYRDGEEYWAVPLYGMVQMLWYRKDLFDEAGITSAPATWEEMLEAAARLTSGDTYGVALPAGKNLATDQVIYSFMITAQAENLFDDEGNIAFDNPDTIRTFDFYNQLLQHSPADSANYSWGEPQAAFNSGTAAMAVEKGQYLTPFTSESGQPASSLGCALIPQPGENGQPGSIYYSNGAMIMSSDAAKQAAAGEFLKYLLEPETYGSFLNAEPGLFLPLTQDGQTAESWLGDPVISGYGYCVDLMLEQSQSGMLFGFTHGQYQNSIGFISGQNIIAQTIQKMYIDQVSPEDAVKWGDQQMEEAIK